MLDELLCRGYAVRLEIPSTFPIYIHFDSDQKWRT